MTPRELLNTLRARGVVLASDGNRLKWSAPPGILAPGLLAALGEHKAVLLAILDSEAECARLAQRLASLRATAAAVHLYHEPGDPQAATLDAKRVALQEGECLVALDRYLALDGSDDAATPTGPGEVRS